MSSRVTARRASSSSIRPRPHGAPAELIGHIVKHAHEIVGLCVAAIHVPVAVHLAADNLPFRGKRTAFPCHVECSLHWIEQVKRSRAQTTACAIGSWNDR